MPTYEYLCEIHGEFEEFHSITIKLEFCPECEKEGRKQEVKRLISCQNKGVVELTMDEMMSKAKQEGKELQREASRNANTYANLLGESRYHQLQSQMDRAKRER